MTKNSFDCVFPASEDQTSGLSKLEYFAAMAMQGIIAGNYPASPETSMVDDPEAVARLAVMHARALCESLDIET